MGLIVPTVHMNGDSRSELLRQQRGVIDAAEKLLEALREASPNSRNYYPQGPDAINEALNEHSEMMLAVQRVHDDAMVILIAIYEQGKGR